MGKDGNTSESGRQLLSVLWTVDHAMTFVLSSSPLFLPYHHPGYHLHCLPLPIIVCLYPTYKNHDHSMQRNTCSASVGTQPQNLHSSSSQLGLLQDSCSINWCKGKEKGRRRHGEGMREVWERHGVQTQPRQQGSFAIALSIRSWPCP